MILYSLIKDEGLEKVVESVFIPNQNNEFVKFDKIYSDKNIDDELKNILILLGENVKGQLLHQEIISFEHYFKEHLKKLRLMKFALSRLILKFQKF